MATLLTQPAVICNAHNWHYESRQEPRQLLMYYPYAGSHGVRKVLNQALVHAEAGRDIWDDAHKKFRFDQDICAQSLAVLNAASSAFYHFYSQRYATLDMATGKSFTGDQSQLNEVVLANKGISGAFKQFPEKRDSRWLFRMAQGALPIGVVDSFGMKSGWQNAHLGLVNMASEQTFSGLTTADIDMKGPYQIINGLMPAVNSALAGKRLSELSYISPQRALWYSIWDAALVNGIVSNVQQPNIFVKTI